MNAKGKITKEKIALITSAVTLIITLVLVFVSYAMRNRESQFEASYEDSVNSVPESQEVSVLESSLSVSEVFNEISDTVSDESVTEIPHGWVINELGYTYVYGDCGYEQFNYKSTALNRYANALNNVANALPEKTRLFNITVPVSSTFASIPREIYTKDNFYNQAQSAFVSTVYSKTQERVIGVPIVSKLEEEYDNGEYVFFRTDKNWTQIGAYYAYAAYCESADIIPFALHNFPQKEVGDFLGSFYNATASKEMADNPDKLVCCSTIPSVKTALTIYDKGIVYTDYALCENKVDYKNAYNVFLGRNAARYELSTTATGGSLLIIGDSSAYPMLPFLAAHYSKIELINPTLIDTTLNEYLSNRQFDDCIVMCYSTSAISGDFVPELNLLCGVNSDE